MKKSVLFIRCEIEVKATGNYRWPLELIKGDVQLVFGYVWYSGLNCKYP